MQAGPNKAISFNNPFIPLKHPNFRYYWIGMCISLIGTWMQNVAQPWLAYSLTQSAFLLGLVGALQFLPMMLFSLFAGVVVDRFPTKRIICFTQLGSAAVTLILAVLVLTGHIRYWHILLLATALGMVNTIDMPARQSFVIQLVGKDDLMNAIALNSAVFNAARIIGPAVAGLLMAYYGAGICFLLNSISFGAVLVSLLFVHPLTETRLLPAGKHVLADIKEGLAYVFNHRILLQVIVLTAIIGTFAMNNNVLIPVFSQVVLNQDEKGLGLLFSFAGIGSFAGAMLVAAMSQTGPRKLITYSVPLVISMLLVLTSLTDNYVLTGIYLAATGLFFNLFSSTANATVQLNTTNEFRGRVMSLYTLVFAGSTPIGNLYAGIAAEHLGAQWGFAACGAIAGICLIPVYLLKIKRKGTGPITGREPLS